MVSAAPRASKYLRVSDPPYAEARSTIARGISRWELRPVCPTENDAVFADERVRATWQGHDVSQSVVLVGHDVAHSCVRAQVETYRCFPRFKIPTPRGPGGRGAGEERQRAAAGVCATWHDVSQSVVLVGHDVAHSCVRAQGETYRCFPRFKIPTPLKP